MPGAITLHNLTALPQEHVRRHAGRDLPSGVAGPRPRAVQGARAEWMFTGRGWESGATGRDVSAWRGKDALSSGKVTEELVSEGNGNGKIQRREVSKQPAGRDF